MELDFLCLKGYFSVFAKSVSNIKFCVLIVKFVKLICISGKFCNADAANAMMLVMLVWTNSIFASKKLAWLI